MSNELLILLVIVGVVLVVVVSGALLVFFVQRARTNKAKAAFYQRNSNFIDLVLAATNGKKLRDNLPVAAFTTSIDSTVTFDTTTYNVPLAAFRQQSTAALVVPAHYGYSTGVYAIDSSTTSQSACDAACIADPYCHSCSYDTISRLCSKSTLNAKLFLKYFAKTPTTNSPLETSSTSDVHFILRTPSLMTGATISTCDCNTLCSTQGSYALGTLDTNGRFFASGQLSTNDVMTRMLAWKELNFCNGSNCPPFNGVPVTSAALDTWALGGAAPANVSTNLNSIYSQEELASVVSLANAKRSYGVGQSDFFTMLSHAVDHKVCACISDPMRKPLPLPDTVRSIQPFTCPFRVPDVEDFDPHSIVTDTPSFNPQTIFS